MRFWILLSLTVFATPALAERQSFPPTDEAGSDPDLEVFRKGLKIAVANRDVETVVASACPDIHLSLGGQGGPEELRLNLTLPPETLSEEFQHEADELREEYWTALSDTLEAPGYFDEQGEFWMPYQWQIRLPADVDPFDTYFVTGERVALRSEGTSDATILDLISHEVVFAFGFDPDTDYQKIRLTDGAEGYMHRDFLWSMVGYRAAFAKSPNGDWQLCTFVAGD